MDINTMVGEWAYRVNNGMPDPKNRNHLELLEAVLRDYKYSGFGFLAFETLS